LSQPRYINRGFGLKQVIGGQLVRHYHSPLVEKMREEGFVLQAGDLTFRLAQEFGFCYGVDRAIEYAYETREKFPDRRLFITGEIIHNPGVNTRLTEMGIRFLDGSRSGGSLEDLREDDVVLLPAFGVPVDEMARLREKNVILVDTTCGSVLNVWKNVERYARDGFTALIHGKYAHEETRATASRALQYDGGHYVIVRDMDEAMLLCGQIEGTGDREEFFHRLGPAVSPAFDPSLHLLRVGCANQTTMLSSESLAIAAAVRRAMVRRWGESEAATRFRTFDTICSATQDRQDALYRLLDRHPLDLLLVIGGYNSSNTGHLLEIGLERGIPTYHIQHADCVESLNRLRHQSLHTASESETASWLPDGPATIGITAGASTPNWEIEAVVRKVGSLRGLAID
jgi:4-hydroxy-3-methylbut-2-enyl diphosphate reductase